MIERITAEQYHASMNKIDDRITKNSTPLCAAVAYRGAQATRRGCVLLQVAERQNVTYQPLEAVGELLTPSARKQMHKAMRNMDRSREFLLVTYIRAHKHLCASVVIMPDLLASYYEQHRADADHALSVNIENPTRRAGENLV